MEENRGGVSTDRLCQIMDVSPRGFRAYRSRPMSQSQRTDMVLLAHIREQHKLSLGSYALHGRIMRQNAISVVRYHCPAGYA